MVEDLGFFQPHVEMPLLNWMQTQDIVVVMLGSVFNVVLMLISAISVLLIYSLLMVTVEQKTFDNGVMRMIGVSKLDCVLSVTMQTLVFVVPGLILAYSLGLVGNYYLYSFIYTADMGLDISVRPDWYTTVQAVFVGLLIPLLSSIIPI